MNETEISNLTLKSKEILDFATREGFTIFYGKPSDDHDYDTFNWDTSKDWKEFFSIAKNEGAKLIIASIKTFNSTQEEPIQVANSMAEEEEDESDRIKESVDFAKYDGKVASYQFIWAKDGIRYSLSDMTRWYSEYDGMNSVLKSAKTAGLGYYSPGMSSRVGEALPKELKNKTDDELAKELIEYVKKESDNAQPSRFDIFRFSNGFWMEKGLNSNHPGYFVLKQNVGIKVEQLLEKEERQRMKQEKERMPELVNQCVKWCIKNNIRKVTQGDIGAFDSDNELSLTREGSRTLWQKVNVALRTSDL